MRKTGEQTIEGGSRLINKHDKEQRIEVAGRFCFLPQGRAASGPTLLVPCQSNFYFFAPHGRTGGGGA